MVLTQNALPPKVFPPEALRLGETCVGCQGCTGICLELLQMVQLPQILLGPRVEASP